MDKVVKVFGRIKNITGDGEVLTSAQVIDESTQQRQSVINKSVEDKFAEVEDKFVETDQHIADYTLDIKNKSDAAAASAAVVEEKFNIVSELVGDTDPENANAVAIAELKVSEDARQETFEDLMENTYTVLPERVTSNEKGLGQFLCDGEISLQSAGNFVLQSENGKGATGLYTLYFCSVEANKTYRLVGINVAQMDDIPMWALYSATPQSDSSAGLIQEGRLLASGSQNVADTITPETDCYLFFSVAKTGGNIKVYSTVSSGAMISNVNDNKDNINAAMFMLESGEKIDGVVVNASGVFYHHSSFEGTYYGVDKILASRLVGKTIKGLLAYTSASIYPLAFIKEDGTTEAYSPAQTTSEQSVDVTITQDLLDAHPNTKYIRLGSTATYLLSVGQNENVLPECQEGFYITNGSFVSDTASRCWDYISITEDDMYFANLINRKAIGFYGCLVYNADKTYLGAYNVAGDHSDVMREDECVFSVTSSDIISQYATAKYVRVNGSKQDMSYISISSENDVINDNISKSKYQDGDWKLLVHKNVLCIGDSVTQGFVTESNSSGSNTIYSVKSEYSYPTQLGKMIPYWTITNAGRAGISPYAWVNGYRGYEAMKPNYNFANYDMFIIELGYNSKEGGSGALADNYDKAAYRTIVSEAREKSPEAAIFLTLSSNKKDSDNWETYLTSLATEFGCKIIDLRKRNLLDLSDLSLHGKDADGNWDLVHFNRKGYAAKAQFIYNEIKAKL